MFKSKTSLAAGTAIALLLSFGSVEATAAGISAGEAARIRHQIHEHHQMQRVANADRVITRREHAWLARDAAQVRHLIQTAKTN